MARAGRRRAEDLWCTGEPVVLDDGNGRVELWMQAVNEPEEEVATSRAAAQRARILLQRRDPESTLVLEITDEVLGLSDEYLTEYLALHELHRYRGECEAEEAEEEEWSKDSYLTGLQDLWDPPTDRDGRRPKGLKDEWAVDHDHPEASRVFAELKRYLAQVEERLVPIRERVMADLSGLPRQELEQRAIDKLIDSKAQMVWTEEFRRCLIWLGLREPDNHLEYYYPHRETIDRLPNKVRESLEAAAARVNVEVLEGKGLRLLRSSSSSSAQPGESETAPSSGPAAATG